MGSVDWANLAQDTDEWWPVVDTVIQFSFYKMQEISLLTGKLLLASQAACFI